MQKSQQNNTMELTLKIKVLHYSSLDSLSGLDKLRKILKNKLNTKERKRLLLQKYSLVFVLYLGNMVLFSLFLLLI